MRIGDVKNFNMRKWRHKNIKIIKIEDEQTCKCFSLPAVLDHFWISPVSEGQILCWESTRLDMDNYSAKKFSSNNLCKYKAVTRGILLEIYICWQGRRFWNKFTPHYRFLNFYGLNKDLPWDIKYVLCLISDLNYGIPS